jgi:hypothetical protein
MEGRLFHSAPSRRRTLSACEPPLVRGFHFRTVIHPFDANHPPLDGWQPADRCRSPRKMRASFAAAQKSKITEKNKRNSAAPTQRHAHAPGKS